jgi:putative oxidoreductase
MEGGTSVLVSMFGGLALWGPVVLRLGAGITMVVHGHPKMFGLEPGPKGFAGYLKSLGFPNPLFWAYVVGVTEFVGGICLLLGLLTRLAALVIAIEFLVIIVKVKWSKGFLMSKGGWEWDWALLTMAVSLLLTGPGRLALDNRLHSGF